MQKNIGFFDKAVNCARKESQCNHWCQIIFSNFPRKWSYFPRFFPRNFGASKLPQYFSQISLDIFEVFTFLKSSRSSMFGFKTSSKEDFSGGHPTHLGKIAED
jgi:hypothetical protein